MQVFAYKMCNFLKKVFQCPPNRAIFLFLFAYMQKKQYLCSRKGLRADVGRASMRSKND